MLDTYDNWGEVDEEQKNDFISEMGSFIVNINETLNSFASGIELRAPDPKYQKAFETRSHTKNSTETLEHFEGLLYEWCISIERYLEQPLHTSDMEDVGPRGI
jgi:hypothetical protein